MASDKLIQLPHKVGGMTLAEAAKSEYKNQIEMTQLMAFMVYAHFIIICDFDISILYLSFTIMFLCNFLNIFHFWPFHLVR